MININRYSIKNADTRLTRRIMRVMALLLMIGVNICYASSSYSQSTKLNLNLKNKTIKEVFSEIEKNSEYIFLYHDENIDTNKRVSVDIHNQTIEKILDEIFKNTNNTYYISDRQIFVSKTKKVAEKLPKQEQQVQQKPDDRILIKGTVKDNEGEPLIGVTVKPKKHGVGSISTPDGTFSVYVDNMDETLIFTYIGMRQKEVKLKKGTTSYNVIMDADDKELGSVVVEAGIIQRNKLGFTGSYSTMDNEELKSVGNINVIQTLKTLDPSFNVMDNNLMGSDPNTMATITMRGGSTMDFKTKIDDNTSNPNEPLFILDGFETDLQTINDLDINRIESITLLKDAGSTAIYGSKGANGVVVVETIKPKAGQVMINYNGDFQVAAADLGVYNMMNAKEKLEFEKLSGRYGDLTDYIKNEKGIKEYNDNLHRVTQGIDTYWLKVPIRTAFTQAHSLSISGGNKDFLYQLGANYRGTEGVMKDSDRDTFGGNARLTYRNAEKRINISNNVSIMVTNGYNGSWGSFSNFVNANPYYTMRNSDGTIPQMLDEITFGTTAEENVEGSASAPNPYYNAMLNSKSNNRSTSIVNNTSFDWFITDRFRWQASLSLQSAKNDSETFKDPRHTDFIGKDYTLQGTYTGGYGTTWKYNANTSASFSHSFKDAHNITFIGRAAIDERNVENQSFVATGFPKGAQGIPSFAHSYQENGRPSYTKYTTRMANFLAALNYNYKWRYVFDFNYNVDGSSAFGSKKQFQDFWNVGFAWNVHQEEFGKALQNDWLQELKIRGSYGINGNQNVSNVSESVYYYFSGSDIFGMGSYLNDFANSYLKWQVAKKLSAGIDLKMLKNRLSLTFDVYQTKTDPLVVPLPQRPSTGLNAYPLNIGYLDTKGVEFKISYYAIRNLKDEILLNFSLSGAYNTSKYGGFNDRLRELNEQYWKEENEDGTLIKESQNINSLIRYEDGKSPSTLWAVRSLGIDPATGREVFLTKDGLPTFNYRAEDRVDVGNSRPDLEGVFGINFTFKKLTASMFFRYKLGAYAFNTALYNKVDNVSKSNIIYNQDKRALYNRWKNPGDISQFKNIDLTNYPNTPISSRFIQKDNQFKGESFKISWDFTKDRWIKSLYMRDLRVSFSMNDLFIISSMKQERGTDYPFQRAFSVGLTASF